MSNLYLCPDDFWNCPIDNNHRVLAKRFQYHVRRCMIANPHIQRVRCVFNANHLTTPQDLFNHMSTCPDAISTSTVLIGLSDIGSARSLPNNDHCRSASTTNWQMFHDVNATEDWDDDIREKQARNSTTKEEWMLSSIIQSSTVSPKPNEIERKSATSIKQAHEFKEQKNSNQVHSVEADDLTNKLMRIRTLQLIGGAGRGACCLLPTQPSLHQRN